MMITSCIFLGKMPMWFYHPLLISESLRKKEKRICRKLRFGIGMTNIYVIVLGSGTNLFDIYHCAFFKFRFLRRRRLCIVGLADSHEAAVMMLADFMADIYQKTGNTDFKSYFQGKDTPC